MTNSTVPRKAKSTDFSLLLPASWASFDLTADPNDEAARLIESATPGLDRDSRATRRHLIKTQIEGLVEGFTDSGSTIEPAMALFPMARSGDITSTASIVVCSMPGPDTDESPPRVLARMAASDPTSAPVPVGDSLAVRTSAFKETKSMFKASVDEAEITEEERAKIRDEVPSEMHTLRVTYVYASRAPVHWMTIFGSVLVPFDDPEHEVVTAYVELFDAVVSTLSVGDS